MLDRLTRAICAALHGTPSDDPPPPRLGWLGTALVRQRARQIWHRRVVEAHLGGVDSDEGEVPGLSGWRYYFHGVGCCLTGPDGEAIEVDRRDDAAAIIDPWFFARRVESVRTRELPEARLWRWMPHAGFIVSALGDLRAGGAIEYSEGRCSTSRRGANRPREPPAPEAVMARAGVRYGCAVMQSSRGGCARSLVRMALHTRGDRPRAGPVGFRVRDVDARNAAIHPRGHHALDLAARSPMLARRGCITERLHAHRASLTHAAGRSDAARHLGPQ